VVVHFFGARFDVFDELFALGCVERFVQAIHRVLHVCLR
jgi:hypothetical protein